MIALNEVGGPSPSIPLPEVEGGSESDGARKLRERAVRNAALRVNKALLDLEHAQLQLAKARIGLLDAVTSLKEASKV